MPAASPCRPTWLELYRWFALAAANGDSDAARKRDEVASRLDAKTLEMAKQAAQGFTPEHEPVEAVRSQDAAGRLGPGGDARPQAAALIAGLRVDGFCVDIRATGRCL